MREKNMREILFRGKSRWDGKWLYGSYMFLHVADCDWTGKRRGKEKDTHFIVDEKNMNEAVYPETVGQYTGLKDKNGKRIFEGDIVKFDNPKEARGQTALIIFEDSEFRYHPITNSERVWNCRLCNEENTLHVIGNIHDNPELLND